MESGKTREAKVTSQGSGGQLLERVRRRVRPPFQVIPAHYEGGVRPFRGSGSRDALSSILRPAHEGRKWQPEMCMDIREAWSAQRASWWMLVVGLLLGGMAATGISLVVTPTYESHTQLFVSTSGSTSTADVLTGSQFS